MRDSVAVSYSLLQRWFNRSKPQLAESKEPATPEQQFRMGLKFAQGEGVLPDQVQAARYFAQAAEQNHGMAQYHLAMLYANGQGVRRDHAISLQWLSRAANQGLAVAQCRLGAEQHLASRTAGATATSEARIEALKWVQLSAAQGSREALNVSESIALGMTLEEVAESSRRVARFVAN